MKKNDIIFDSLSELSADIISEAAPKNISEIKVKKRRNYIGFAATAAGIALIATIQYRFFIVPLNEIKNTDIDNNTPAVTDSIPADENISDNGERYELLDSLKKFRTENSPVRNTVSYTFAESALSMDIDNNGYYHIDFLKNNELQNKINEEIKIIMDECRTYYTDDYTDPEYYSEPDLYPETAVRTNWLKGIYECHNGYLSVLLFYYNYSENTFEHVHTINYELFSGRKITDYSELFEDSNYISVLNQFIENSGSDSIDAINEPPVNFTVCEYFDESGRIRNFYNYSLGVPFPYYYESMDIGWAWEAGLIPLKQNRDMSELIKDDRLRQTIYPAPYSEYTENDRTTYMIMNQNSVMSQSDTDKVNEILLRLEKKSISNSSHIYSGNIEEINIPYAGLYNFWGITISGCYPCEDSKTFLYDSVTEEELTLSDIITDEGVEYIKNKYPEVLDNDNIEIDFSHSGEYISIWSYKMSFGQIESAYIQLPQRYIRNEYVLGLLDN